MLPPQPFPIWSQKYLEVIPHSVFLKTEVITEDCIYFLLSQFAV
jgi:hypothetical protein